MVLSTMRHALLQRRDESFRGLSSPAAARILALAALALGAACGAAPSPAGAGTGGAGAATAGTGGSPGSGGSSATGGASSAGSGGSTNTGGVLGSGGRPGSGGVSGGTGGAGAASCASPPDPSALVGWATVAGATIGGGTATPTMVTTLAQLNSAAAGAAPAVIWVTGSITGNVIIGSNKTIVGLCGAQVHGHVDISGAMNVILRNITIIGYGVGNCALDPDFDPAVGCSSGQDAISIQNRSNHVWLDHCDISDGTDGNLDITTGANYVTISWTKFHYSPRTDPVGTDSTGGSGHRFSNLVGGDDNALGDLAALNITWHHNWWADNVVERQPRVRFGKNHLFDNLWSSSASSYCVRAGKDAQILIENGVFSSVKNPQQFNSAADQATAFITATNDLYNTTTGTKAVGGGGTPFTTPPYPYMLDQTAALEAAVRSGAGPK